MTGDRPLDVRVTDALDALAFEGPAVRDWLKALSLFGAEHPATLGCLLALVREAWSDPTLNAEVADHTGTKPGQWFVTSTYQRYAPISGYCVSEPVALVRALEALS